MTPPESGPCEAGKCPHCGGELVSDISPLLTPPELPCPLCAGSIVWLSGNLNEERRRHHAERDEAISRKSIEHEAYVVLKAERDSWFNLAKDCVDYMEHHATNCSEEETALVVRYEEARRALGDGT
jgi:hypothetical protein